MDRTERGERTPIVRRWLRQGHGFFSAEDVIIDDTRLDAVTGWVYCALARHANAKTGECWPSQTSLARRGGVGRNRIREAIATLDRHGYLLVERRHGSSNRYFLLKPGDAQGQQTLPVHHEPLSTTWSPSARVVDNTWSRQTKGDPDRPGGRALGDHEPDPSTSPTNHAGRISEVRAKLQHPSQNRAIVRVDDQ